MSNTGLPVFDETLQLTHSWLKELMEELGWEDRHRAYLALRLTLQALRDHLSVDEAAQLGAQLPMLVRGFYYEGWHPAHKPIKQRNRERFVAGIQDGFLQNPSDEPIDAAEVVRSVFKLLDHRLSPGQAEHLRHALPKGLRDFWPAP